MKNGTDIASFIEEEHTAKRFGLAREAGHRMVTVSRADAPSSSNKDAEAIAQQFWRRAESFVDEANVSRFIVASYDEHGQVREQFPFRIGNDDISGFGDVDPPTTDGQIKARMRDLHNRETSNRKLMADLHQRYRSELDRKETRIEALETKNAELMDKRGEALDALEAVKSEAHTRRLNQIDAESTAQTKAWLFQTFMHFVPIIAAHYAGSSPLARWVKTLDKEKLRGFVQGLTAEQVKAFEHMIKEGKLAEIAEDKLVGATRNKKRPKKLAKAKPKKQLPAANETKEKKAS